MHRPRRRKSSPFLLLRSQLVSASHSPFVPHLDALETVTFTSARPSKSRATPARTAPAAPAAPRSSGPTGFFSSLFGGSRREAAAAEAAAPRPADAMEVDSDSDDDLQAQTNVLAQVRFFEKCHFDTRKIHFIG